MNDTFEQFVKKYTESIGNDTKLVDSLKKQYEMHCAEQNAVKILHGKYGYNVVKRKQLMPHYFKYFTKDNENKTYNIAWSTFTFDMGIDNIFEIDTLSNNIYVVEGICTQPITGLCINYIEFYIENELIHTVAGHQVDKLYYLESPILSLPSQRLKIKVNLSAPCKNFPLLFIGYKFIGE